MKQITVNARVLKKDENLLYLEVEHGGQTAVMTVFDDMPIRQVAALILDQSVPDAPPLGMQKRFTITYHIETATDPQTGEQYNINVVDDVQLEPRQTDKARSNFKAMGQWATWSALQAVDYVEQNVTNLATAKAVIERLVEMVVYLREMNL